MTETLKQGEDDKAAIERKEKPIECDNCGKLIYPRDSKARAFEWHDSVYYLCCDECVVEFARDCTRQIYHWEFLREVTYERD